jgi:hypothetical protein
MKKPLFPTFKCQTCADITLQDTQVKEQFIQECQFYAMHIRSCSAHTSVIERLQLTDFILDSCQFFDCTFSQLLLKRVLIRNSTFFECQFAQVLTETLTSSEITFENCSFIDTDLSFFSNPRPMLADLKFVRCIFIQTRSDKPNFQQLVDLPITLETFLDRRPTPESPREHSSTESSPPRQIYPNLKPTSSQTSKAKVAPATDPNTPFHEGRFGNLEIDPQ